MHKSVAVLIRDITQFGGGEKDVIVLIEGLNEKGITPTLFSEKNATSEEIKHFFGKSISYSYKCFPRPATNLGRVIAEIFLAHPLKNTLEDFDVVYDFTNKPPVPTKSPEYIKYIYIIEDRRVLEKSFLRRAQFSCYSFFAKIGVQKFNKVSDKVINVTQSHFSQKEIREKTGKKLPIIYPPVLGKTSQNAAKKRQFLSVGRITPEKNYDQLISIAKELPNEQFILVGKLENIKHLSSLQNRIATDNIQNIEIHTDASQEELKKLYITSQFYISTTKEEHFGISIVEAINHGCITFSHNSGEPAHIINNEDLLFSSEADAVQKIKRTSEKSEAQFSKIVSSLQEQTKEFSEKTFKNKILSLISW